MTHSAEINRRVQTLQPKFRWRIIVVFIPVIGLLSYIGVRKGGVYKACYGGLAGLAGIALVVQYRREHRLIQNHLSAVGAVTDYRIPFRGRSKILNFLLSQFSPDVPIAKYSFTAFDQKTYTGQTGWGTRGLYNGAPIVILYNPENPAANHPLRGFVFFRCQVSYFPSQK